MSSRAACEWPGHFALPTGEMLFIPRAAVEAHARRQQEGGDQPDASSPPSLFASRSKLPPQPAKFRPKDTLLYADRELVIVNKPALLPMHGPGLTVESTYTPLALGLRASQTLLATHSIGSGSSGVLILAKGDRSCEELKAAFRGQKAPSWTGGKQRVGLAAAASLNLSRAPPALRKGARSAPAHRA